jgi:hypothetical protein
MIAFARAPLAEVPTSRISFIFKENLVEVEKFLVESRKA